MKFRFENIEITGIAASVPSEVLDLQTLAPMYGSDEVQRVIASTGIEKIRIAPDGVTTADLCEAAAKELLRTFETNPADVDGIVFVSQTPDYILPATSVLLQHRLRLGTHVPAFDLPYGRSGYIYGLFQAALLIHSGACSQVLLCAGDTITRFVHPEDRPLRMSFGDGGSATLVRRGTDTLSFTLHSDGSGAEHLIVRGVRGHIRSAVNIHMDGMELMNFGLREVPAVIEETLALTGWEPESVGFSWGACASDLSKTGILPVVELDRNRGAHTRIPNFRNFGVRPSVPISPLLGSRLPVAINDIVFEALLGSQTPALLNDHKVFERPVFPASAFISMAFVAGKQALSSSRLQIDNFSIGQALILPDRVCAQTVLETGTNRLPFKISSRSQDETINDGSWRLHASGQMSLLPQNHVSFKADLSELGQSRGGPISVREAYKRFREFRGLDYGAGFQVIEGLRNIENDTLGRLCLPAAAQEDQYPFHPVLLDGAIQTLLMAFPPHLSRKAYLPISLERCWISREHNTSGWAHARLRPSDSGDSELLTGDVRLYDEEGVVFFEVLGLSFKRADHESVLRVSRSNGTRLAGRHRPSLQPLLAPAGFAEKLRQARPPERASLLLGYVRLLVAGVLQVKPDQLGDDMLLNRLGLDSLRALELRNQVGTDLSLDITMVKFLQKISVSSLVSTLDKELAESSSESPRDLVLAESITDSSSDMVVAGEL